MPFLLLLFLTLVCMPESWQEPVLFSTTPALSAALTAACMGVVVGMAALASRRVRSLAYGPGTRERASRRYGSWRLYHLVTLLGLYALSLYGLGWGWTVQRMLGGQPTLPAGGDLFVLAPFLLGLITSWLCFYDAERALHDTGSDAESPFWGRWSYVTYHARKDLGLICVMLLLFIAQKAVRQSVSDSVAEDWKVESAVVNIMLPVVVIAGIPWVLQLILGLRPMPEGPLRGRLLATAKRMGFRFSNIMLWNTRHGVANAMVAGILPFPRYVVLTDQLVSELSPDEVEAVFGHEVGHVKHHHMVYYLGFLLISVSVVWAVASLALQSLGVMLNITFGKDLTLFPAVLAVGTYVFVVFGFLSRRCERQADIYGCRTVSCQDQSCTGHTAEVSLAPRGRGLCPTGIRTFVEALEKVGRLNGMSRDKPGWLQSWLHSSIARRVDFLQRMLINPTLEPRFQRNVRLVKWGLLIGLSGLLFLILQQNGWHELQF